MYVVTPKTLECYGFPGPQPGYSNRIFPSSQRCGAGLQGLNYVPSGQFTGSIGGVGMLHATQYGYNPGAARRQDAQMFGLQGLHGAASTARKTCGVLADMGSFTAAVGGSFATEDSTAATNWGRVGTISAAAGDTLCQAGQAQAGAPPAAAVDPAQAAALQNMWAANAASQTASYGGGAAPAGRAPAAAGPNYMLIGGVALAAVAAVVLLRR